MAILIFCPVNVLNFVLLKRVPPMCDCFVIPKVRVQLSPILCLENAVVVLCSHFLNYLNIFHIFLIPFEVYYHSYPIHSVPHPLQLTLPGKHSSKDTLQQGSKRVCFQILTVALLLTCFQFLYREGGKTQITVHSLVPLLLSRGVARCEPQSLYM